MPLFDIPFPAFDPVLLHLGPLAIRWYALAYIVGILAGWLYARHLIRSEKYWSGPAPMTVTDFDDFVLWVTLGIILGGRIGVTMGTVIEDQFTAAFNWPLGAALSFTMLAVVLLIFAFSSRVLSGRGTVQ